MSNKEFVDTDGSIDDIIQALKRAGLHVKKQDGSGTWFLVMCLSSQKLFSVGTLETYQEDTDVSLSIKMDTSLPRKQKTSFEEKWKSSFSLFWDKRNYFDDTILTMTPKYVLHKISLLSFDLESYGSRFSQPLQFSDLNKTQFNTRILPFFAAGDTPELCEAALNYGLSAASPAVTAVRRNMIDVDKLKDYAEVPDEWVTTLLFP